MSLSLCFKFQKWYSANYMYYSVNLDGFFSNSNRIENSRQVISDLKLSAKTKYSRLGESMSSEQEPKKSSGPSEEAAKAARKRAWFVEEGKDSKKASKKSAGTSSLRANNPSRTSSLVFQYKRQRKPKRTVSFDELVIQRIQDNHCESAEEIFSKVPLPGMVEETKEQGPASLPQEHSRGRPSGKNK